ncbi:MAG: YciI family protein [Candidatus Promineifilaceae bacterium]
MTNFVLLYSGGSVPETEAEQAAVMAAWGAWMGGIGAAMVDGGNPTSASKGVSADGSVGDPAVVGVSGYSIVSAETMDAAVAIAQGCPILQGGGQVSVYETFAM